MLGNVDRISEGYVIIIMQDNSTKTFKYEKYPFLKQGQIVNITDDEITVDEKATQLLKDRVIALQKSIFKK